MKRTKKIKMNETLDEKGIHWDKRRKEILDLFGFRDEKRVKKIELKVVFHLEKEDGDDEKCP